MMNNNILLILSNLLFGVMMQSLSCQGFLLGRKNTATIPTSINNNAVVKTSLLVPPVHQSKSAKSTKNDNDSPSITTRSKRTTTRPTNNDLFIKYENEINDFCQGTYNLWKQTVIPPVRDYFDSNIKSKTKTYNKDIISKLISPPQLPGIPRPVWLVILGSIPTALGWYGYYKFSIEEELYQLELQSEKGKVSGFGGYGTLFPFVYGIIIGFPMTFIPGLNTIGPSIVEAASVWILLSQINLYRRVNELCMEIQDELDIDDPPLYEWWAILPPPLDVVVGLRQIHFLSEYWRIQRGEEYDQDIVAEILFPFISWKERFTLKTFFRTPSMWFWFTKDMKDFDFEFLKE